MFDIAKIQDPEFFRENRVDAHSDHIAFANEDELRSGETSFRYSLNGLWKFHYAKNPAGVIEGFEKPEFDNYSWDDIKVPSSMQMEGYDKPHYTNSAYPWDGLENVQPNDAPVKFNPVGSYVKYFEVPENMKGHRIFVSFQGVEGGMALYLNGAYVGYSTDSFTPKDFELTDYLCEGTNKLALLNFKWTSSSWLEDQDFFRFSGIFRDVYLYMIPDVHVTDVKVLTNFGSDLSIAELEISTKNTGKGKAEIELIKSGKTYVSETMKLTGADYIVSEVNFPQLWSAEKPVLYNLLIKVFDEDGNLTEIIPQAVGFRKFEIDGNVMKINGQRIVFKGVNRHEFSAYGGRYTTDEELLTDILTMKANNINAIRTSHYPNKSKLYEYCDRYGLYVIDETNLETHGVWDQIMRGMKPMEFAIPGDRKEYVKNILDRANSMYQRDKNHPCILIWSLGNESFGGKDLTEMTEFFHEVDSSRIVHYEGIANDGRYPDTSDVVSRMYPSALSIREYLLEHKEKPYILCEYSHAMGNSCGAMHKYTELAYEEELFQGGFVWDYIDQSIINKDRYGKEFYAYGGDFDDRPTDYNFSGNGIAYGSRKPSPKMQEVKFNYQNIAVTVKEDSFDVFNKNLFTKTSEYDCVVTLEQEGKVLKESHIYTEVLPLSRQGFGMPFAVPEDGKEYVINVSFRLLKEEPWAGAGYEVAFGQGVFKHEIEAEKKYAPMPEVIIGGQNLGLRGKDFSIIFSGAKGLMTSYVYGGKEMLAGAPKENFWRAPTDNDAGNAFTYRYAQWKIASMYYGSETPGGFMPEVAMTEHSVIVTFKHKLPTTPETEIKTSYEVFGDGEVKVTLVYNKTEGIIEMPEFGMLFKMDADYDHVCWYGLGKAETYADRKQGAKLGVYKNLVADNMAEYLVPQECGAHEEVRYAKVTDAKGRGLMFTGDKMGFSALPYSPHEMENALHPFELPQVHYTYVRVTGERMGIGGDDSWGAKVHPEYLVKDEPVKTFTFSFKGIV